MSERSKKHRRVLNKKITEDEIGCTHPYTRENPDDVTIPLVGDKDRNAEQKDQSKDVEEENKARTTKTNPPKKWVSRNDRFHPVGTVVRKLFDDDYFKEGVVVAVNETIGKYKIEYDDNTCLLYTSPSPRD